MAPFTVKLSVFTVVPLIVPTTSNLFVGTVDDIPTLPLSKITNLPPITLGAST